MTEASVRSWYDAYWARAASRRDLHAETRTRLLLDGLAAERHVARALDVGAGLGGTVAALRAAGYEADGLDVSAAAVAEASARVPAARFVRHDVESLPWPVEDGSLDAVVAFEVVEHLLRPRRLLEGAHRSLRRGGLLALTTPHHGRAKNVALALLAFERHFAVEGEHIRFFTDRALRRLLEETGFAVETVRHFGRVRPVSAGVFVLARRA